MGVPAKRFAHICFWVDSDIVWEGRGISCAWLRWETKLECVSGIYTLQERRSRASA